MPELPEVEALTRDLASRLEGRAIAKIHLAAFSALKTFDPPLSAVEGTFVDGVTRHGKFLDISAGGLHVILHLARAGWVRWRDEVPALPPKPSNKSPLAARIVLDDPATEHQSGLDITEAGTKKSLAVHIVDDPQKVPRIASLGPDPLAEEFGLPQFAEILGRKRAQIKGVLRDQSVIAGVGNAYSDEVLHVAKLSPYAKADSLDPEAVSRLYNAMRDTLNGAIEASAGKPAAELKDAKRSGMRVHGRAGEKCPECGDVVREVSFADRSMQYCATCQTGGKTLADRRMSRLLK